MTGRKQIALALTVGPMIAVAFYHDTAAAFLFVASLIGIWVADWMDMQEAKTPKPTKTLLEMQTELSDLQVKVEEMNAKVSAVAISNATKSNFLRRP